jgi:Asp-tRNA(Asn)/Glu-tRNA(Gln) amidotransferase C subunit
MKAYLALKTGERYDKYGQLIDSNTHPVEAVFEAFGFSDAGRRDMFMANKKAMEMTKSHKEDVVKDVKTILDYVSKNVKDVDGRRLELIQRSTAFALSRYRDDPVAMEIFRGQLLLRLQDPNEGLLRNLLKASGLPEANEIKDTVRMSSLPEEQKQLLIQRIEDVEKLKESK